MEHRKRPDKTLTHVASLQPPGQRAKGKRCEIEKIENTETSWSSSNLHSKFLATPLVTPCKLKQKKFPVGGGSLYRPLNFCLDWLWMRLSEWGVASELNEFGESIIPRSRSVWLDWLEQDRWRNQISMQPISCKADARVQTRFTSRNTLRCILMWFRERRICRLK